MDRGDRIWFGTLALILVGAAVVIFMGCSPPVIAPDEEPVYVHIPAGPPVAVEAWEDTHRAFLAFETNEYVRHLYDKSDKLNSSLCQVVEVRKDGTVIAELWLAGEIGERRSFGVEHQYQGMAYDRMEPVACAGWDAIGDNSLGDLIRVGGFEVEDGIQMDGRTAVLLYRLVFSGAGPDASLRTLDTFDSGFPPGCNDWEIGNDGTSSLHGPDGSGVDRTGAGGGGDVHHGGG